MPNTMNRRLVTVSDLRPFTGLKRDSREFRAVKKAYDLRRRLINGATPLRASNATIRHKVRHAIDDRPDYLSGPYTLAVDTETTGLRWFADSFPFLATASDYDRDYLYKLPADNENLRRDILNAERLVFHNASFDIHMLVAAGIVTLDEILEKDIQDTDLLARCVLGAGNGPFGLKYLATEFIDDSAGEAEVRVKEMMYSMQITRKVDQKELPDGAYYKCWQGYPHIVEEYALKDTRYTYDLFSVLMGKATQADLDCYELERKLMPVIIRMEHTGVAIDSDHVEQLIEHYTAKAQANAETLMELNGYEEINLDSNAQIADLLIRQGVPLTKLTPTGDLKVDKWTLEPFEEQHSVVAVLSEYRQATKFLSTYLGPMQGRDVVHPNYWQIGARTGRMSCSNPNLQNIPVRSGPEVRQMFVPREGRCLLVADYSSIELRLLAYYMNHEDLWAIIENGDPFLWLGAQIYGTEDQSLWPVKRQALKNGFYAMTYGAGGPKLAQTIGGGMTDQEGRQLASKMKAALGAPYRQLNSRIRKTVEAHGLVRTVGFGNRTQYVPMDKSYVGLNTLIQGAAADIMKQGLVNAAVALAEFDGYPLLTVHDEIVAEVSTEYDVTALDALEQAMQAATDLFPLKVEGTICYRNYGEGK